MLRIKLVFFVHCLLLFFAFENIAKANYSFASNADSIIVINPFPLPDPNRPRSPVIVPICASYESLQSSVILSYSSNLGEIEIEVLNSTTGGYYSGVVNSQEPSSTIPITMGSGHYIIIFTLPSGQRFRGEFDV